ncbi:hypothetical protein TVAG_140170 [Trichomonas vaginalis G3]|uniref:Uncharacterized protein n=1 Tax=Trichomonas vaginalis (strain ATCC PRA-98 / G3) TaxID=412133 RepID=A2F6G0_TRIV3|nr:protein ubiquitination [Trichomonas vaginalis G3]EAX99518.1 hypothetical protein TVAG_140170 [Trichomonas vaginalis G3]KAI5535665.1 protein ubiquitination [Trichomonas vaginalis G3]|eukprot:XP_001312448.1 hypothetical protein [Trichomonas vaginalis G3]
MPRSLTAQVVPTSEANTAALRNIPKLNSKFLQINNLLEKAANEGDEFTIKVAVDEMFVDVRDTLFGIDALLNSVFKQNNNLRDLLIKFGANPKSRSKDLNSMLHLYALKGSIQDVELALQYIDINSQDIIGNTALHYARRNQNNQVYDFLIAQPGADLTVRNAIGKTPEEMVALRNDLQFMGKF